MSLALISYLPTFLTAFVTVFPAYLTSSDASSLAGLLEAATQMFQWFITSMGSLITFITSNPIILVMFLILLSGAVVGMFMRIWKSA